MKTLRETLKGIEFKHLSGDLDQPVAGIKYSSKDINPQDCFVAIRGFKQDGNLFVDDAIQRGASAIVSGNAPVNRLDNIAWIEVENERETMGRMAGNFYSLPSKNVTVIGVTGTNGKTTVALLIREIIAVRSKCGFIGTLGMMTDNRVKKTNLTTPESVDIHDFIHHIFLKKCYSLTMEVSSVALELDRVGGIPFSQAVFTNLSGDHLDFHQTLENYFKSKLKLFKALRPDQYAIVNLDDSRSADILSQITSKVYTYGFDQKADVRPVETTFTVAGTEAVIATPAGNIQIKSHLIGKVNLSNILAAVASAVARGISSGQITEGIARFEAPKGRLDLVYNQEFSVLVDYAHTDGALQTSLESLKELLPTGGRLILVFGAGGDRDKTKRPRMGAAAAKWADLIVLTNDNPRSEDPRQIAQDITTGFPKGFTKWSMELDRAKAIDRAVQAAETGDIVMIAGKGHEDYQIFKEKTIHFDDFEMAKLSLMRKNG